jgi:hypothetical protein
VLLIAMAFTFGMGVAFAVESTQTYAASEKKVKKTPAKKKHVHHKQAKIKKSERRMKRPVGTQSNSAYKYSFNLSI